MLQSLLGELRKKVVDGAKETADTRQLIQVNKDKGKGKGKDKDKDKENTCKVTHDHHT